MSRVFRDTNLFVYLVEDRGKAVLPAVPDMNPARSISDRSLSVHYPYHGAWSIQPEGVCSWPSPNPDPNASRFAPRRVSRPDCCRNRKIRYCPDHTEGRFRVSPSFPRKRESSEVPARGMAKIAVIPAEAGIQ